MRPIFCVDHAYTERKNRFLSVFRRLKEEYPEILPYAFPGEGGFSHTRPLIVFRHREDPLPEHPDFNPTLTIRYGGGQGGYAGKLLEREERICRSVFDTGVPNDEEAKQIDLYARALEEQTHDPASPHPPPDIPPILRPPTYDPRLEAKMELMWAVCHPKQYETLMNGVPRDFLGDEIPEEELAVIRTAWNELREQSVGDHEDVENAYWSAFRSFSESLLAEYQP